MTSSNTGSVNFVNTAFWGPSNQIAMVSVCGHVCVSVCPVSVCVCVCVNYGGTILPQHSWMALEPLHFQTAYSMRGITIRRFV